MLTSYIISAQSEGSNHFGSSFPTIFQIQDLIENAWDNGINAQGRAETGGVKGTRKYIGTPEVWISHRYIYRCDRLTKNRRRLYFST
jgi:hypothetical protein